LVKKCTDWEQQFPGIENGPPELEEMDEGIQGDLPSDFDDAYHDCEDLAKCHSVMVEEEEYCKMIMKTNKEDAEYFENKLQTIEGDKSMLEMNLRNQLLSE
jgi:hypothetical protein